MPVFASFLIRRTFQAFLIIVGIVVVNFVMLNLPAGDMADVMAGNEGGGNAGYADQLRKEYGLDRPLGIQLVTYMGGFCSSILAIPTRATCRCSTRS